MSATRPQSVPEDASLVPSVAQHPVGNPENVQLATIESIKAQDARMSAGARLRNAQALTDWKLNCQQAAALGIRPPARPVLSPVWTTHVVYADMTGKVEEGPDAATGSFNAWVWDTQEQPE